MAKPKIHPRTYSCINCKTESNWRLQKSNKFCSLPCQHQYNWITKMVPEIEAGAKTKSSLLALRKYVIERDGCKCNICNLTQWLGAPISLDLDHIDGDNKNNFPNNLRLLCPNCHRQTPTWGNKKRAPLI